MKYWWLNYGEDIDEQIEGDFIALPVRDSVGVSKASWGRLKEVQPGDIAFGFEGTAMISLVVVDAVAERAKLENAAGRAYQALIVQAHHLELRKEIDLPRMLGDMDGILKNDDAPWQREPGRYGDIHELPDEMGALMLIAVDKFEGGAGLGVASDALLDAFHAGGMPDEEVQQLADARTGFGTYRDRVMALQGTQCCITGLSTPELLLVAQIKSWVPSSNEERLDLHNALVLAPTLQTAFLQGMFSFDEHGNCLVSELLDPGDARRIGLLPAPKVPVRSDRQRTYLAWHRAEIFRT